MGQGLHFKLGSERGHERLRILAFTWANTEQDFNTSKMVMTGRKYSNRELSLRVP